MNIAKITLLVPAVFLVAGTAWSQFGAPGEDWPHYAGDHGSTKYSPLSQINAENFENLEVAWRWASVDLSLIHI